MHEIHLGSIDLNLLRVFDALYEERSVTRAGTRLALTQSAVSHALGRLRTAFGDDLFVRGPNGMTPTPRAAHLWPDIRRGLDQLQRALAASQFDAARTDRRFHVAAPAAITAVLLPPVIARVRTLAPRAELRIQRVRGDTAAAVEIGAVDVGLGAFSRLPDSFAVETVLKEPMVWVMRRGHPAAAGALTVELLSTLPLLMIAVPLEGTRSPGAERRILIDDGGAWEHALGGSSARDRIMVTVDDVHAALSIVAENDLVALLPRRVAAAWAGPKDLKLFEPPYPSQPLPLQMIWRESGGPDPGVRWLLDVIREVLKTI